jgi:hypothetical protein
MAKAKKRVAARKKISKRGKASAKPARKKAAKHTTSKKAKSKVRAGRTTPKSAAKKKPSPKTAARKAPRPAVEVPVEDTIIDVIEEPVPGTVVVTEYESVRIGNPVSSSRSVGPETEEQ